MEPPGGQPTIKTRVDQCGEVFWVEDLARDRNNGFTGSELMWGQRGAGVAANKIKDLFPLWIGDGALLGWWNEVVKSTETVRRLSPLAGRGRSLLWLLAQARVLTDLGDTHCSRVRPVANLLLPGHRPS